MMGWSIGYDDEHKRDIGYAVPAYCDHPGCDAEIDRGLAYKCGEGSDDGHEGCGLFFCGEHKTLQYADPEFDEDEPCRGEICEACRDNQKCFPPKPDHPKWMHWKLTDESWKNWRKQNPEAVKAMRTALKKSTTGA